MRGECWCWWEMEVMRFAETLRFYSCRFVVLRSSSVTHRLIILTLWRVLILSFHKSISGEKLTFSTGAFLCGRWPCPTVPGLIRNEHYRDECTPASTILYLLLYCVLWPPCTAGYDVPFDIFYDAILVKHFKLWGITLGCSSCVLLFCWGQQNLIFPIMCIMLKVIPSAIMWQEVNTGNVAVLSNMCVCVCSMNLTWRDMQHLVVRTSQPGHLSAADWKTNGVGRTGTDQRLCTWWWTDCGVMCHLLVRHPSRHFFRSGVIAISGVLKHHQMWTDVGQAVVGPCLSCVTT